MNRIEENNPPELTVPQQLEKISRDEEQLRQETASRAHELSEARYKAINKTRILSFLRSAVQEIPSFDGNTTERGPITGEPRTQVNVRYLMPWKERDHKIVIFCPKSHDAVVKKLQEIGIDSFETSSTHIGVEVHHTENSYPIIVIDPGSRDFFKKIIDKEVEKRVAKARQEAQQLSDTLRQATGATESPDTKLIDGLLGKIRDQVEKEVLGDARGPAR